MPVRGLLLKSVQAKRIYERGDNPADIDTEGDVIELGVAGLGSQRQVAVKEA